jgi:hypothetical protein
MNNLNLNPRGGSPGGNLSGGLEGSESDTARLVARARVMMIISVLTTALAIAAVVTVIGYRMFSGAGGPNSPATDEFVTLPKGARIISTVASAGRLAVTLDIGGTTELRIYDIKTMKQTGRIRFAIEP